MDFKSKTFELFDALGSEVNYDKIMNLKDKISEIAEAAYQTRLFRENSAEHSHLLKEIARIDSNERRVIACLHHLLLRINLAPTPLHMVSSIIIVTPVLDQIIKSINLQPDTTCQQQ